MLGLIGLQARTCVWLHIVNQDDCSCEGVCCRLGSMEKSNSIAKALCTEVKPRPEINVENKQPQIKKKCGRARLR